MPMIEIENGAERLQIACLDEGEGFPVLLIHGFGSTKEVNWVDTGWVRALRQAGFRVVAIDNRGHGGSTKFHEPERYTLNAAAEDARLVLDALAIDRCHVVGYSMGARIAAMLAIAHGARIARLVLSGNGWGMVEGSGDWTPVREALLADSLDEVSDPRGRTFRKFAEQTRSDRRALAACVEGLRQLIPLEGLAGIENQTLIAIGTEDDVAGSGERLAAAMRHARFLPIPGRDHMRSVGDKAHVAGVVEFLLSGS